MNRKLKHYYLKRLRNYNIDYKWMLVLIKTTLDNMPESLVKMLRGK